MMSESNEARPYPDVPWLTAAKWADILESADDYGATGFHRHGSAGFDWDALIDLFETSEEPWPGQYDHPMIVKFQSIVRKAWREAN